MPKRRQKKPVIRLKIITNLLLILKKRGYKPADLRLMRRMRVITPAEYEYIAHKIVKLLAHQLRINNFKELKKQIKFIRHYVKLNWNVKAQSELRRLGRDVPKMFQQGALRKKDALTILISVKKISRKFYVPAKKVSPFKPLNFEVMRRFIFETMKAGEPLDELQLISLKEASTPEAFRQLLKKYSGLILTYQKVFEQAEVPYYYGELTPTAELIEPFKKQYDADISLGKLGALWSRLQILNDEKNPLYTLLGKKPEHTIKKIMRKTNKKAKNIYIYGLFQWNSPSPNTTYDLVKGDFTIWGFKWYYSKGKRPYDYISKVYRPSNLSRPRRDGGYRVVSQLEDTFSSRFIDSKVLRFVKFLGLYVPVKR